MARTDKRQKEQEKRQALKEARRSKKREETPDLGREAEQNQKKPKILIVCEGKNTEPSYFKQFKVATIKLVLKGIGYNTLSLVEKAEQYQQQDDYEEVWCIFDHDPKPSNPNQSPNFDNAVKKAESLGYKVGYSNQAFEYWLLLHFKNHQGSAMPRADYYDEINSHLAQEGLAYNEKSKIITKEIFEVLQVYQENAIDRAKKIHQMYQANGSPPSQAESSTTVYMLVEKLMDL